LRGGVSYSTMKNVGLFSLTLFSMFLLFLEFPGWENRRENVRILSGTAAQASKRGETVRLACFEIKGQKLLQLGSKLM
jgi:hypothetical protein